MTLFAGPAGAAIPAQSLGQAGSDTTYWMISRIAPKYQASTSNTNHDIITEIPPVNQAPFPASVTVPADAVHPAMTWDSSTPANTPPNGSSAGIIALNNDLSGQIAFTRSSRGPNAGETTTKEFWAYALGALDFVVWPGGDAPAKGLTQAQLQGIYTCSPQTHLPFISDWSQVGGKTGHIFKYAPQTGSGTYSFFNSKLLGGETIDQNCNSAVDSTFLEEHDARGVDAIHQPQAIFAYDWARYNAQRKGFEANLTNGSILGKFGVTTPVLPTAANVNETKTRFFGTRYVYNVMEKHNHPGSDTVQMNDILRFIGVRTVGQGGAQYICSGKAKADIIAAGFVPLALFGTGGTGLPKSYCRLDPTPL